MECRGYQRNTVFVNQCLREQELPPKATILDKSSSWQIISKEPHMNSAASDVLVERLSSSSNPMPTTLNLNAFEDAIVYSYLVFKLPIVLSRVHPPPSQYGGQSGAGGGADLASTSCLSARALAASYFARVHHLESMVVKGAALYGRALQSLRQSLQDPEAAGHHLVLASMMYLNDYERVIVTSETSWFQHIGAISKIVSC